MAKAKTFYVPPKGTDQAPLTIRQMEALRKENLKKTKDEIQEFELDVLTTPKKPMKSVPKLRKAINEFFEAHADDPYLTMNELATAIGYADEDAMVKDSFNIDNRPKYNAVIRKAVSKVENLLTRKMLAISEAAGDTRGYQVALQRMDKKRDKYDPDSCPDSQTQVRVNIQMQENENIKNMLDDRLSSLLSLQKGNAVDITPKQIPVAVPAGKEAMNA